MRLRHQRPAGGQPGEDHRRRVQAVHGAREDRPDPEQAGLRRQVGRVVAGHHHDRGGHRGVPLRHVAQPVPAAQAGS